MDSVQRSCAGGEGVAVLVTAGLCAAVLALGGCVHAVASDADQALACLPATGAVGDELPHGFAAPVPIRSQPLGAPVGHSRVVYLNRSARTYVAGIDDAQAGASSVVSAQGLTSTTLTGFKQGDAAWNEVRDCIRQQFAAVQLAITDIRPVTPDYIEAHFGGSGSELVLNDGSGGIAPIDNQSCNVVDGAVVFVFTDLFGGNTRSICEVGAHEIAHVFSLDHEYQCKDPMTYIEGCGDKDFQPEATACGELSERPCICGRTAQSSVDILHTQIGDRTSDVTPPVIDLLDPVADPSGHGTYVQVKAHDPDAALSAIELHLVDGDGREQVAVCGDGTLPCTLDGELASFAVPGAGGDLSIWAVAQDTGGNRTASQQALIRADATGASALTLAVSPVASAYEPDGVVEIQAIVIDKMPLVETVLVWQDGNGDLHELPLCPRDSDGRFGIAMHLGRGEGARRFHVRVTDAAGRVVNSTEESVRI